MRKRNPRRHHFSSRSRACGVLGEVLIKPGYARSAVRAQCRSHARDLVYLRSCTRTLCTCAGNTHPIHLRVSRNTRLFFHGHRDQQCDRYRDQSLPQTPWHYHAAAHCHIAQPCDSHRGRPLTRNLTILQLQDLSDSYIFPGLYGIRAVPSIVAGVIVGVVAITAVVRDIAVTVVVAGIAVTAGRSVTRMASQHTCG